MLIHSGPFAVFVVERSRVANLVRMLVFGRPTSVSSSSTAIFSPSYFRSGGI